MDSMIYAVTMIEFGSNEKSTGERKSSAELRQKTQALMTTLENNDAQVICKIDEFKIFVLCQSTQTALQISKEFFVAEDELMFKVLLAVGEVIVEEEKLTGTVIDEMKKVSKKTAYNQVWMLESFWVVADIDKLAWEDIGTIRGDDQIERKCFRLVQVGQCFLPSSLKKAIMEDHHVILAKGTDLHPETKTNRHIIFTAHQYNEDLHAAVAKIPSHITNSQIWLVIDKLSLSKRREWLQQKRNLVITTENDFLQVITNTMDCTSEQAGLAQTIALNDNLEESVMLEQIGIALPSIPMANIVEGYSLFLTKEGNWLGEADSALLRIDISLKGGTVTSLVSGNRYNSQIMIVNQGYSLGTGAILRVRNGTYRYIANLGSAYLGGIFGPATLSMGLQIGDRIELGRQPIAPGFSLPDRGGNENIIWADNATAQRSQKQGLTLDRALTGRHHATVTIVSGRRFSIAPVHDKLPTFILQKNETKLKKVRSDVSITQEGIIVVGTNILKISQVFS